MTREEYEQKKVDIKNDVLTKTNEENIKSLSSEAMTYFLGNYSDGCRTCIYKTYDICGEIENSGSCVDNRMKWLARNTADDKDDVFMFVASRENVVTAAYNAEIEKHNAEIDKLNR